jgi:DNA-directed RNA polymerase subunit M/transcription elongation factor TFIIS
MNICPTCKTVMKKTELQDVFKCPSCATVVEGFYNRFNFCADCGKKLGRVNHKRRRDSICYECRGDRVSNNPEVRKIFEELKKENSKKTPKELGMNERFVDDPKAEKEQDTGRVIRKPTQIHKGGIEFE